jgi:hypothetical protein
LAAKRKINPCFSGSRERHGESQPTSNRNLDSLE